ncbi:hypothetical protein [Vibrio sp. ES.051]
MIPVLLSDHNDGQRWQAHGVTREQVLTINK